jgi:hypothetical protein
MAALLAKNDGDTNAKGTAESKTPPWEEAAFQRFRIE